MSYITDQVRLDILVRGCVYYTNPREVEDCLYEVVAVVVDGTGNNYGVCANHVQTEAFIRKIVSLQEILSEQWELNSITKSAQNPWE